MPQLNKGGKYVFGWSMIRNNGEIYFPPAVLEEYSLMSDPEIIIFTGSKVTGGFCVTNRKMLQASKLQHILKDLPELTKHLEKGPGDFMGYKGRSYAWLPLSPNGSIKMPVHTMSFLNLISGAKLMSIRSSDIAFTMGAKGPLVDKGLNYAGHIEVF